MGEVTTALPNIDELKRVGIVGQKQKDYYLIRLRTIGGGMTDEELGVVAAVSRKYGSGVVHFTTRQGVEIHNIHVDNLRAAREELEQGGIVLGGDPQGRLEGGGRIALQAGKTGLARVHGHTPLLCCF